MCLQPRFIQSRGQIYPCGYCPKCKAKRVSHWSFRLLQEQQVSSSAYFITLTYDDQNVPVTMFGHLTLKLRDLQLFYKRLRKAHSSVKGQMAIKHYTVGEYGGRTERPHYHAIIFNVKPELVEKAWSYGTVHFGKVEGASVGYTLKYITKNRKRFETYDGRKPEFAVMSKGLGISYLDETMCEWHADDLINRMYCGLKGGIKISMPRYYKDRLYFELEKAAIAAAYELQITEKQLEEMEKQTPLTVRNRKEDVKAAFEKMYSKSFKTKI